MKSFLPSILVLSICFTLISTASHAQCTVYNVAATGSTTICSGATGPTITLDNSVSGVSYQLKRGTTNVGTAKAGTTGTALNWTNNNTAGTYTITANKSTTPTCSATMNGSVVVTVNALPTAPTVTNGSRCGTGTVSLSVSSSTSGIFNLYTASTGGTPLLANSTSATSYVFTTPSLSATTTYYVTFNNGTCQSSPRKSVTATINTVPTVTSVTGGTTCGTGTVPLQASSSAAGTFKLYAAQTGGSALSTSPSSLTSHTFTSPSINATKTYYVTVTTTGNCESTPRTAVVATVAPPQSYTVGGGGALTTQTPSVTITLSGSQPSVNYQLKLDGVNSGSAVAGNNTALSWTVSAAGTYSVAAQLGTCSVSMGSVSATNGFADDALEYAALKDLYLSTNGSSWVNKTNWPASWPASATSTEFGTWFGVSVSDGDVSSLQLGFNNLTGTIPASLGNLTLLSFVGLNSNNLSGGLPVAAFSNARGLQYIYLDHNQLSGPLPAWSGANFQYMQYFNLSYNQFTGTVPTSYITFAYLDLLDLAVNQLTGFPSDYASMTWLKELRLAGNPLPAGPIPSWISQMSGLHTLLMGGCNFTGTIPASLGNLHNLTYLSLNGNQLTGAIPAALAGCTAMTALDLMGNQLDDMSNDLSAMTKLGYIGLSNNRFHGPLPEWFGHLPELYSFQLDGNQFTSLPSSFSNLSKLAYVYLQNNQLTGRLPDVSKMTDLYVFNIEHNQFSGAVPPSFSSRNLYLFNVGYNQLSGEFPSITNWTKLVSFSITGNRFLGAFPSLSGLNALSFFDATSNHFGSFPTSALSLPSTWYISFENNRLTAIDNLEAEVQANQVHPPAALGLLYIGQNQLDFKTIGTLATLGFPIAAFPQKEISDVDTVSFNQCNPLIIPSRPKNATTTITWYKKIGDQWVDATSQNEDVTSQTFLRASISPSNEEIYYWSSTDTQFLGVVIKSKPIVIPKTGIIIQLPEFVRDLGTSNGQDLFKLTFSQVGISYQLKLNNVNVPGALKIGTGSPLIWEGQILPGKYTVNAFEGSCNSIILTQSIYQFEQYPNETESDQNFIKVEEMYTSDLITTPYINQKRISYQYVDGLGRPIQSIDVKGSALSKDIVTFNKFDVAGRSDKEYMSYTSVQGNGLYKTDGISDLINFYSPSQGEYNNKVKTDASPFSSIYFEPSPLNRISSKTAPGSDWQQSTNTIRYEYGSNIDGNSAGQETIPVWTISLVAINSVADYVVASSTNFPSGSLYVYGVTDESGKQLREYSDKQGRTLFKKLQYSVTVPQTYINDDWAITSYIYDDLGNLRFVLQPELQANLTTYVSASNTEKRAWLDKYAFEYRYDEQSRMIYKKAPGAKPLEMIYDQWDRLVLTRDGRQKTMGVWSFLKYDALNRVIITGEISSSADQSTLASNIAGINNRFENQINGNGIGYSLDQTYPTSVGVNDIFSINYYDDYSFTENLGLGTAYDYSGSYLKSPSGLVTGSKVRVLDSTPVQWLVTASYYDDRLRQVYAVSDDHLGNKNRITNSYFGITSWVSSSKLEHGSSLTSLTETTYDHRGNVLNVYQTLDSNPRVLVASNQYNEVGQLVEKNIHSTNEGSSFIQSTDYRYNVRGWLTHINNSELSNDALHNDDANDLFGMELKYTTGVNVGTDAIDAQYNGNISSIAWKTNNLVDIPSEKIYGFRYDPLGRLNDAKYATRNGTIWNSNVGQFNEDNISYDRNGNILHLDRKSNINGTNAYIDQLGYTYNGNQLTNVIDDSPYDNTDAKDTDFGFTEIIQSTGITEYQYDDNGNMKEDDNKGIISITYNHLNLPTKVELEPQNGSSRIVEFTYSAIGDKLKKTIKIGSQNVTETDYVGGIQYEKGELAFLVGEEGRMIKNGSFWQYEYRLKDHLGNARVAYGILQDVSDYKASMETELATRETDQFSNLTSAIRSIDYNHTKPNIEVSIPSKSAKLNGFTGNAVGPAKILQVKNGDRVSMETFAYCPVAVSSNAIVPGIAAAVTGAFGLMSAGEAGYHALNGQVPVTAGAVGKTINMPKAYLCYILFDNSYAFVQHGFYSVGNEAQVGFQQLALDVTVPSDGYMFIYVANESNVSAASSAYFDDLSITHFKNSSSLNAIQSQDYYPFGLTFNSHNKENNNENRYLFNGSSEFQPELGLGFYSTLFRMYDPAIGRFMQIDPLTDFFNGITPYNFAFDNPILYSDPDGLAPLWFIRLRANLKQAWYNATGRGNIHAQVEGTHQGKRVQVGATTAGHRPTPNPRSEQVVKNYSKKPSPTPPADDDKPGRGPGPDPIPGPPEPPPDPIPTFRDKEIPPSSKINYSERIQFDVRTDRFTDAKIVKSQLGDLVKLLIHNTGISVYIAGNAYTGGDGVTGNSSDAVGQPAILNGTSTKVGTLMSARARAVYNFLVSQGVNPKQLIYGVGNVSSSKVGLSVSFEIRNK